MDYEEPFDYYDDANLYDEEDLEKMIAAYDDLDYNDEMEYARISFFELAENCLYPTLQQTVHMLAPLYVLCITTRLICVVGYSGTEESLIPRWLINLSISMGGLLALHMFFGNNIIYLLICAASVYVILLITAWRFQNMAGLLVAVFTFLFIVICELFVVEEKTWHSVRGAQIMLSMKVIGLGFDISSGVISLPSFTDYMAYIFCAGNVIFGPWISFLDFKSIYSTNISKCLAVDWMTKVMKSSFFSVLCLSFSTCFGSWIILDSNYKWIRAYRDAQSFRFSHYFVCFVSETTAALAGINPGEIDYGVTVTRPFYIELPRSLVDVVTNWNLPMHNWLKNYVFKIARPHGTFLAVILTYVASSLLHGLNFQLAAVLLSLGFYSYVEMIFRKKLSQIFQACLEARSCRENCPHTYQYDHPYVRITNLCFGCLSVFHLAYLGLMFDSSEEAEKGYNMSHTLQKWSDLDFLSHWVIFGTYIFHLLV
ncbi:protein-serine O-palmitoleoyltransferase porcupine-like [Ostrea edulis]|uniref:protein-serine O-palmitoleoyltransferase porcupine-like n=1 Tax=Ostrea edulis TaxID=37623 RepID=UPI002094F2BE|nr:protein-serine O-palmitoleoyltransferase porcupine-like [Ostrea edulis]